MNDPKPGSLWQHVRTGGIYIITGTCRIEKTNEPGVLYQQVDGSVLWCRPLAEFTNGRFRPLALVLVRGEPQ